MTESIEPGSHDGHPTEPAYLVPKDARVQAFWAEFCATAGVDPATDFQAWHFGDSARLANELIELVVHGDKRATAGLGWVQDRDPALAPILGGYSVVTEFDGKPRAVIRTVRVERRPFCDVDAAFAWSEGEGERTLESWRRDHWAYFSRECAAIGCEASQTMLVVLETFELSYPQP